MDTQKITVEKRQVTGRKVKNLRAENILPANIFGKGIKSQSIQLDKKVFTELYEKVGETGIVELSIDKKAHPTLIANIQLHPVTSEPIHVDFKQVNLKEKVSATVPVVLVGEAPAEKNGEGTVIQQILEIEVEALPTDLPDEFELDTSKLEKVDDFLSLKDLKYDKSKIEIEANPELIVAKVEPPQEEETQPQEETSEDVEIITEKETQGDEDQESKETIDQKEESSE